MNKTILFASASALVLTFATASAAGSFSGQRVQSPKGTTMLYNQNSNGTGEAVTSDVGEAQAADDFVVPDGATWTITEVDVTGQFFNGSGPAGYENVVFYKDKGLYPGKALKKGTFNNIKGAESGGNFAITLPGKGLKLEPGHYWVSVIPYCDFATGCGEWGWELSSVQNGNQAVSRSTGSKWIIAGPGLMFDLQGTSKGE
jgi:hypothetical protein